MSTKYILIGGYVRKTADGGKAFCEELVKGFVEPVRILDCLFAEPEEIWKEKLANDKTLFAIYLPDKKLEIQLASPNKFIEQVQWANAIYLRGGETAKLISTLKQSKGWSDVLKGKTLAGTSAGANAIAKYYYSLDKLTVGEGLGLLPIKVLIHYRSDYNALHIDWDKAYSELRNHKENLPVLALREGEFKIIEK